MDVLGFYLVSHIYFLLLHGPNCLYQGYSLSFLYTPGVIINWYATAWIPILFYYFPQFPQCFPISYCLETIYQLDNNGVTIPFTFADHLNSPSTELMTVRVRCSTIIYSTQDFQLSPTYLLWIYLVFWQQLTRIHSIFSTCYHLDEFLFPICYCMAVPIVSTYLTNTSICF